MGAQEQRERKAGDGRAAPVKILAGYVGGHGLRGKSRKKGDERLLQAGCNVEMADADRDKKSECGDLEKPWIGRLIPSVECMIERFPGNFHADRIPRFVLFDNS